MRVERRPDVPMFVQPRRGWWGSPRLTSQASWSTFTRLAGVNVYLLADGRIVEQGQVPPGAEVAKVWHGGHEAHVITDEEAAALVSAGWGDCVEDYEPVEVVAVVLCTDEPDELDDEGEALELLDELELLDDS
jgi:hypothetical protein